MAPKKRASAPPAAASGGAGLSLLLMLVASTCMAIAQQYLVKLGATHKTTLSVSWTMYLADVLLALGTRGAPARKRSLAPRLRFAKACVPALDVAGCVLAYASLERLGAGPFTLYFSSILPVSAAISRVFGKRLSAQQAGGILVVSAGLVVRSWLSSGAAAGDDAVGVALALASTLSYAARTVAMEWLRQQPGDVTGAELSAAIGRWGFVALTAWQLLYTVPRWAALVSAPSTLHNVTAKRAALHHGAYVATRAAFVLSQNEVIRTAGATGVGLVTAVRSVAVGVVSSALFCGTMPSQCMSDVQMACAALVVAGGVTYALAAAPRPRSKAD